MSNTNSARVVRRPASGTARLPLAVAIYFAISSAAFAQADTQATAQGDAVPTDTQTTAKGKVATLGTVTVTAQKRKENLQKVPISIEVLDTKKLQEHNVKNFDDYAKLLPSVSYESSAPGAAHVYMRGVASGGDGNHSGPLPSVGTYLDEQPITTIDGLLDLNIYDVARVEALSGPQGTLYGASSEAGTLRIITNKPDPKKFAAGYSLEANSVDHHGTGFVTEGFINQPINDHTAIRLVAWNEHDGGYISNVEGQRTYPSSGITVDNSHGCVPAPLHQCTYAAKKNANDVDKAGLRAALKFDLNENWTITPAFMTQRERVHGNFAQDSSVGDLALTHFYPDKSKDYWYQAALTVEGKIGNFDLTYAYANLYRKVDAQSDYSDYSFWYDTLYGYGNYIYDNSGALINPSQHITSSDWFRKQSHEIRIASPKEDRLRFIGGFFWQQQDHDIQQRYMIDGFNGVNSNPNSPAFGDPLSVTGWPNTIWLTKQLRRDQDEAIFGELSYDITDKLTATGGLRFFKVDNSLKGFFGFSEGFFPQDSKAPEIRYGEAACIVKYGPNPANWPSFIGAPCTVFDKHVKENNHIEKLNLTYQIDKDAMVYGTWSKGFRPGGINRRGTLPPYLSDFLTNYEFGWKTAWLEHRLTFNGAVFQEDWKDFQFAILGANGLTEIRNANQARIRGFETELNWAATYNLKLSGGLALYNAKLNANYCGQVDANGAPITNCATPQAPSGTRLPLTPKVKGNLTARYTFDFGNLEAYVQGSAVGVGRRTSDLRLSERGILGDLPGYGTLDLSAGFKRNGWAVDAYVSNVLDKRAALSRYAQCAEAVCGNPNNVGGIAPNIYTVPNQPRTIGLRFSQEF